MKPASISDLKKELENLPSKTVLELCVRIVKYKKENKELLTYLLFEADDEAAYVKGIKEQIDEQFAEMNKSNLHFVKKSLRKILRVANKFVKYSGNKQTEVEVLIYYCQAMKSSGIKIRKTLAIQSIYERQLVKIKKAIDSLHEDLRYDYREAMEELEKF